MTDSMSPSTHYLGFTYLAPSRVTLQNEVDQDGRYNVLRLLVAARYLDIDVVPHQWEYWLGSIGQGGSATINQAFSDLTTSFAFKRFQHETEETAFRSAIQEMSILGLQVLGKQNIVRLQGVSLELTPGDGFRPTLVYEKSKHGDLYAFASSSVENELKLCDRMSICRDIGTAILFMHSCNIIHGDIKPQNVLIFEGEDKEYHARISDFAYSTLYARSEDEIAMPMSEFWHAPEQDREERLWTSSDAKKMDIFSFGMLSLWFLAGSSLVGVVRRFCELVELQFAPQDSSPEEMLKDLLGLIWESEGLLPEFVDVLMNDLAVDDADSRREWATFFRQSLKLEPHDRNIDDLSLFSNPTGPRELEIQLDPRTHRPYEALLEQFEVMHFFLAFYQCDHKLRYRLYRFIQEEGDRLPDSPNASPAKMNLLTQKAICLWYGFGVAMNKSKASDILKQVGKVPEQINTGLPIESMLSHRTESTLLQTITTAQAIESGPRFLGVSLEQLEKTANILLQDLNAIEQNFGQFNLFWLAQARELMHVDFERQRWGQMQDLLPKCIEVSERIFGLENPQTMVFLHEGALMYKRLGQWDKAECWTMKSLERTSHMQSRMASLLSLAAIYKSQGRLRDAEKTGLEVLKWRVTALGKENSDTRVAMRNLVLTYTDQKNFGEAERRALEVLEMDERIMGRDHVDVLTTESHIGNIYFCEKRYAEAEAKWLDVLDRKSAKLGPQHPSTCLTMENLAWLYEEQGLLDKSEEYAQRSVLACLSRDPASAVDAIEICLHVWQERLGADARWSVQQDHEVTAEIFGAYLAARPDFRRRVGEVYGGR